MFSQIFRAVISVILAAPISWVIVTQIERPHHNSRNNTSGDPPQPGDSNQEWDAALRFRKKKLIAAYY